MQTLKTNGPGRVLVSDPLAAVGLELLLKHGLTVDVRTGLKPAELIEIIPAYDALLVRSETKVSAAVLGAGKQLKVVARAGVGVDNIDLDAATNLGVLVANAPGGNTISVAEHTVGCLLYTSDAADDLLCVDLGGRPLIKKKNKLQHLSLP